MWPFSSVGHSAAVEGSDGTASDAKLVREAERCEQEILRLTRAPRRQWFVRLENGELVHTMRVSAAEKEAGEDAAPRSSADEGENSQGDSSRPLPPLVLLHGFLSGVGLWAANLDSLVGDTGRDVYCIDWLGFGRSSRPRCRHETPEEAEEFFVNTFEQWRRAVGLEQFVLLGHSMGGFLAGSYALQYPEYVERLVLADPWGVPTKPPESEGDVPLKWRLAIKLLSSEWMNPMVLMRGAGWLGKGEQMIERFRPDLTRKWDSIVHHHDFAHLHDESPKLPVAGYIYNCNARHSVGEHSFFMMTAPVGYAARPLAERLDLMSDDMPVLFLYGSRSWMDPTPAQQLCQRKQKFEFNVVPGAGHHVYIDNHVSFNHAVAEFASRKMA